MAGDDMLSLSKDASETHPLTIIPANGKPIVNGTTNGKEKNGSNKHQHNNNGSAIANGKHMKITTVENGKDGLYSEKSKDYDELDDDMKFGWGSFRPKWLQWMATKQMFLVVFCAIWVSSKREKRERVVLRSPFELVNWFFEMYLVIEVLPVGRVYLK